MGMEKWISRKEEAELPNFSSHAEAREYFKEKYGDSFQLTDSEMIDGQKCYFYYLIFDAEVFWKGQEEMKKRGSVSGLEFLESHQPIQIMEDGRVHIVH